MRRDEIISQDSEVVSGAVVFAGTRVPVEILIDYLKEGETVDRFLKGFPSVSREQVRAFLDLTRDTINAAVHETHSA